MRCDLIFLIKHKYKLKCPMYSAMNKKKKKSLREHKHFLWFTLRPNQCLRQKIYYTTKISWTNATARAQPATKYSDFTLVLYSECSFPHERLFNVLDNNWLGQLNVAFSSRLDFIISIFAFFFYCRTTEHTHTQHIHMTYTFIYTWELQKKWKSFNFVDWVDYTACE